MKKGCVTAPDGCDALADRVLAALEEIGQRLPARAVAAIERTPPRVALVEQIREGTLGVCRGQRRLIEVAAPALDFLDDAALQGLLTHELAHYVRYLEGHAVEPEAEEEATRQLVESMGFAAEQAALTEQAGEGNLRLWEAVDKTHERDLLEFFPPSCKGRRLYG